MGKGAQIQIWAGNAWCSARLTAELILILVFCRGDVQSNPETVLVFCTDLDKLPACFGTYKNNKLLSLELFSRCSAEEQARQVSSEITSGVLRRSKHSARPFGIQSLESNETEIVRFCVTPDSSNT